MNPSEPRLVFVDAPWAYFAEVPEEAWGDDWSDASHADMAGPPYGGPGRGGRILKLAFDGDLEMVGTSVSQPWGLLSAAQINDGKAPWLVQAPLGRAGRAEVQIPAHVTVQEFRALVGQAGGRVYGPLLDDQAWKDIHARLEEAMLERGDASLRDIVYHAVDGHLGDLTSEDGPDV